ncbi:PREDICTED: isoleucine--tRNA ligase, cytoplasmic-like isoform X2 [Tarenaya hassleriana]|uniref:isoleucine--tRNA ligase, cytoplasmic-like isoform X2 n=1 Tax=Tarenaya hassleriana TaxID=28532 RepID=UPI00053C7B24|nr:PREDICTED: isoleucine--tRNA ligase, cytoplasmic-like isoform X2 [Tarenaya hassleriana]
MTQLERTKNLSEYIFYDGPPFATGLPHYGHILAGTIKDIVTRFKNDYKTMDSSFMESVWWVFAQLWDKGLVYRASRKCEVCIWAPDVFVIEGSFEFEIRVPGHGWKDHCKLH